MDWSHQRRFSIRLRDTDSGDRLTRLDRAAGLMTAKKLVLLVVYTVDPAVGDVRR
jgi:hypothetical protein